MFIVLIIMSLLFIGASIFCFTKKSLRVPEQVRLDGFLDWMLNKEMLESGKVIYSLKRFVLIFLGVYLLIAVLGFLYSAYQLASVGHFL